MSESKFKPGDLVYDLVDKSWCEYINSRGSSLIIKNYGNYFINYFSEVLTLSEALERGIELPIDPSKLIPTAEQLGMSEDEYQKKFGKQSGSQQPLGFDDSVHKHSWRKYTGLVETYFYCEMCGEKKEKKL